MGMNRHSHAQGLQVQTLKPGAIPGFLQKSGDVPESKGMRFALEL